MKNAFLIAFSICLLCPFAHGKDHSNSYQMGTYVKSSAVKAGTPADNFDCNPASQGFTACSGKSNSAGFIAYRIDVEDGFWILEKRGESESSKIDRAFGEEPANLEAEKQNPFDLLKNGDKVLFRIETHKRVNGTETDVFIPFADNPNKVAKFVGTFRSVAGPGQSKARSNVRAMCDAHKLSPQLEKKYCTQP